MAGRVTEFDIDTIRYRASPLPARVQLHVAKRLLQLAKALTPAAQAETMAAITVAAQAGGEEARPDMIALMLPFVGSLGDALSQLNDNDFDFILDRCLEVIERRTSETTWARVLARSGGVMFDDITAPVQIVMIGHVLKANLGDFFRDLLRMWGQTTQELPGSR